MTTGCIRTELRAWVPALAIWLVVGCGANTTTFVGSVDGARTGDAASIAVDTLATTDNPSGDVGAPTMDAPSAADVSSLSDVSDGSRGVPVDGSAAPSSCATAVVLPFLVGSGGWGGFNGHGEEGLPACGDHGFVREPVEWFEVFPGTPDTDVQIFVPTSMPLTSGLQIRVYSECPPVSCVASSFNPLGLDAFSVRFTPVAYHPYFVAVGGDTGGQYLGMVTAREVDAFAPANGVCRSALTVRDGTYLHNEDLDNAVDATAACGLGRDASLFYSAHVAAGDVLHVQSTTIQSWNSGGLDLGLDLRLAPNCSSTMCLAAGIAGSPRGLTNLDWRNTTGMAQDVIFAVNCWGSPLRFDLSVQIGPSS